MHPILFHIPLPTFNLPLVWIPLIIAALAALVAAVKMIGADKDRPGAAVAAVVAVGGLVARWMAKRMPDKHYDEIRRQPTPTGFVQQHVLRGTAPDGTAVEIPACLIVTIADGRITRLEEYLDTKDAAALSRR